MRGRPAEGWVYASCVACRKTMRVNNVPRHQQACGRDARERIAVVGPSLDEQRTIVELYRQRGATLATVAAATYWSSTTVGRVLVAWGQPIRKRGGRTPYLSIEEQLLTCELYGYGYTVEQIARRLDRAEESIRRRLLRNGVELRARGFKQGTGSAERRHADALLKESRSEAGVAA